jgi:uncharacterized protein (TIGR00369 family)
LFPTAERVVMGQDTSLDYMPFAELLEMELVESGDGRAVGRMALTEDHSSREGALIAHGGATYSLADTVGGAAVMSATDSVTPTVDMRIDYLAPATSDLRAEAEVVRLGGAIAVVRVEVFDEEGTHVATAHGTYKTDGPDGDETPWRGNAPDH